jgi:hypothetical protein
MFKLEALRAKHGDALLLHYGTDASPKLAVIDGGPGGVWKDSLRPRLMQLRTERGLDEGKPLDIDLMMVSHLDADHITGILDLMRNLRDIKQNRQPQPWRIRRLWHNAFDDLTGGGTAAVASANTELSTASFGEFAGLGSSDLLASVGQGRELRDLVKLFDLEGNKPFESIVQYPHAKNPVTLGTLSLTAVGPDQENLAKLQSDWDKKVAALLAKEADKKAKAELVAYLDKSVYNLSSIVVWVEQDGKTMLLTGDARGDYTLKALSAAGILKKGQPLTLDLLKLPHHGSDRNVDQDYFDALHARHYVISADGKYSNPDVGTLEMISKSRTDDDFTIWLTYPPEEFADQAVGQAVAAFFAADKAKGRKYETKFGGKEGVTVEV